jgi:TolB protein
MRELKGIVLFVCRHNTFRNRRSSIRTRTAALSIFFGLTLITLATAAERKIAFCRGDEVWVANVDGAGAKKICSGAWPDISPDGTRVAFNTQEPEAKNSGTGARHIAVADISTSKITVFKDIPSEQCYDARWSPDGSRISFRALINGEWRRGIVNVDGSDFRVVNGLPPDAPAWARDGKSIFSYDFENLYQIDLDGNVLKKWELSKVLTERGNYGDAQVFGLSMSPDGKMLLIDVDLGGPAAVYTFDLATEKTTRVTSNKDVAIESCWLTNDEFLCVLFKDKAKPSNMRSVYRISVNDKVAKLVIKDARNPSVSAP